MGAEIGHQFARLLGRQIDDDGAIEARSLGIGGKTRTAIGEDRVEIAHEDDRCRIVLTAEIGDHREEIAQLHAGIEAADVAELDRRAIGHRIGERHAEFDDIGAIGDERAQDGCRRGAIGVARRHKGDKRGAALSGAGGEAGGKPVGHSSLTPSASATVKMSLSPRPHKLATIN